MPIEAGADAADDDFAELHVDQRDHAAERGEAVMHGVDRAARGGRGHHGEQRGCDDAEADFLALHVAAGQAECMHHRGAVGFRPVGDGDTGDEQHAHHREDRPALALVADHAAEHIGHGRADQEDREHLHEVRQRRRVLEGMGGVGIEEAAAIGPEHLDRDLRGHRADRDGLLGAFERRGLDVSTERLRHALPDQEQRVDDADRQQHVKCRAGDVDPEITDRAHRGARESADHGHRERDAGRRRQEILVRQAEHLHEIGYRALAAVILPVGIGDEGNRGVEGEILGDSALPGRVERQHRLKPHHAVDDQEAADMKQQHRDRVGQPMLLAPLFDARKPINAGLDRPQHRRQERPLAVEHSRHVPAERFCQRDDNRAKENDLEPTDHSHGINPLGRLSCAGAAGSGQAGTRRARRPRAAIREAAARVRTARAAAVRK
ncbi:hypothetical protein ACVWXQ_004724 [Bradyrhizobium sp. S3.14.4]